ncbi:MAG: 2TM domain-containing protein [Chitinophagaceae bacterium]|nr:2TM domain-containing protein [Chitinophagaceae bacterium]
MANKIAPTSKQKSTLMLHAVIFVVVNALLWYFYDKGSMRVDVEGWAYVWPIWITAAWGLSLIGHWAAIHTNYEDAGNEEYLRQLEN